MYVIEITYGEYDDYNHIPIMVVQSIEEASLICETIEQRDDNYLRYAEKLIDWLDFKRIDFGTNIIKLPLVTI